jgi:hypothetical protein
MPPKVARKKFQWQPGFSSNEGRTLPNAPITDDPPASMEAAQKSAKSGWKRHFSPVSDARKAALLPSLYNSIVTNIWKKNRSCKKFDFFT